jgi:hypothetical protein
MTQVVNPVAWRRLQHISCAHALVIGAHKSSGRFDRRGRRYEIAVPEVIRENCEILGRGSDVDVKYRLLWYATYHPKLWERAVKEVSE